ncbi:class I adenylate-forming enzyme family protein [Staphylococcus edaphicus]|uniref:Putative long chain fatty acid-CoA ligase VraA n=1 Tax=Staphylococcus edaphicus TaxID=1955013 RepID=A0A2C6WCY3_9STAP|nr:class I adenylate-forming enzyme family protein [Staphylococcus edaphicus]PHK48708.1 long-chain fatty acid--CoA ligase [Staphylococcus edaphicus]UQW81516.1 acyl--CoA ligase [Staphylococcus edaphicus]
MNYDWIKTRATFDEPKAAIIDPFKGTEWTYQDLNIRAENLANYLRDQGVKRGDVVGIFSPNDVALLDLLFASFKIGAVYLPINWRLKTQEIESVIIDSDVKLIFYAEKHLSSLEGIADERLHIDIDSQRYDDIVDPQHHRPFKAVSVDGSDLASLMYTSGTTGLPKGVMFTYDSFVNNPINIALTYKMNSTYTTIISTPMFHVLGFNDLTLPLLMAGGTLVLQRYFNGEALNELMTKYKPNYLIQIPTMYYAMLAADNFDLDNFNNLEFLIQGGSSPLPSVQKQFSSVGFPIINGYGLTEAPLVMVNTPENGAAKPGSIGQPVLFMDICIFDDNFEEVQVGEIGELGVRGNNVTPGYWNKPEETAKSFHGEYFLTGDLARVDEEGDVFIVDRRKEMIITGGENVLPSEVETVLANHPLVAQCVVAGYESPKYGESVSAAVVLTEDNPDFEQILDAHMREHIAGYKIPRMYMKLTHLPLNSTSKPDKLEIQKYMNEKAKSQGKS